MPILCTKCVSINLWVTPLSTNTDTLCPRIVPLTLKVRYLGTPLKAARVPPIGANAPSTSPVGGAPPPTATMLVSFFSSENISMQCAFPATHWWFGTHGSQQVKKKNSSLD